LPEEVPPMLRAALVAATRAIQARVQAAAQRIEALRRQSRERSAAADDDAQEPLVRRAGAASASDHATNAEPSTALRTGPREPADEIAAIEADIAPWIARYRLDATGGSAPAPLACAAAQFHADTGSDRARMRTT